VPLLPIPPDHSAAAAKESINNCRHNAPARSSTLYVMLQAEADTNEFIGTAD